MDDVNDLPTAPTLRDHIEQQGTTGALTLREHLEVLRTWFDGLYAVHAQAALDALDVEVLALAPVMVNEEGEPPTIAYHLPNHEVLRVLPGVPFVMHVQGQDDIDAVWYAQGEGDSEPEVIDASDDFLDQEEVPLRPYDA